MSTETAPTSALDRTQRRYRELVDAMQAEFERQNLRSLGHADYQLAYNAGAFLEELLEACGEYPRLLEKLEVRYLP